MIYLIAGAVTLGYGCFVLILLWHWARMVKVDANEKLNVFASVIIPVRNESENIERLIQSIQKGQTDSSHLEIIVVDDHSTDQTRTVIKSLQTQYDNLNLAQLTGESEGKKAAISYGVSLAKGELVICTDGDSMVADGWLDCHRLVHDQGSKLAFGPVKLFNNQKSPWIELLNQELAALVAMGAATLQMGKPTMINGCNYSFSKQVFEEVKGFSGNEQIASGDDEFLLRKVFNKYPNDIHFLKSPEALVTSEPPKDWHAFYNQRRRWASKWKFHQDLFSKLTPLFLFLTYGLWIWLIADSVLALRWEGLLIQSFKLVIDYVYIASASKIQRKHASLIHFVLLQIIYPFYVVFFGVASNFGEYSWRGRTHKI